MQINIQNYNRSYESMTNNKLIKNFFNLKTNKTIEKICK